MSNPKLEITVCVNTLTEQTHMLALIVYIQRALRQSKLPKPSKCPQNRDALTNLARMTVAKYLRLVNENP